MEDYCLRALSNGRYTSVVPTRSIAEGVFLSGVIQGLRDSRIDLDATAEHCITTQALTPFPTKRMMPRNSCNRSSTKWSKRFSSITHQPQKAMHCVLCKQVVDACATAKVSGQTVASMLSAGSAPSSRATRRFFLTPRSSVMPPSVASSTFPQITRNVAAWATQARRSPSSSSRRMSSSLEVPSGSLEQTAAIAGDSPSARARTLKRIIYIG